MGFLENRIDLPAGENLDPDPARVDEIRSMLVPGFRTLGPPAVDRLQWGRWRDDPIGIRIMREAERAANLEPRPTVTDELYRYCLEHEGQAEFRDISAEQQIRMSVLPIALSIDPDLDLLPEIERDIDDLLNLTSWIHPANDDQGLAFAGRVPFNDLLSLHHATSLITASALLGDLIGAGRCQRIADEIRRRVLDPFRERIETGRDVYWWICHDNNWNSVCLSSILCCALALCDELDERAWFVAVVEQQIRNSVRGFSKTGFYTEGVAYWGYGFGHYVLAAETVRAATGGRLDWLLEERVTRTARYGRDMEIQDGITPSFADCRSDVVREAWLVNWPNNRIDPRRTGRSTQTPIDCLEGFRYQFPLSILLILFYQEHPAWEWGAPVTKRFREWYDDVQFLICRPGPGSPSRLAATFKGGHNGVSHNHNDLGTYTVQVDDRPLLVDPGAELYTGRTFGPHRYESDLLNSRGHPVPVVAGQLQSPKVLAFDTGFGTEFFASIIEAEFSEAVDRVVLNLKGAYQVESLVSLTRTFRYLRSGEVQVEVTDRVVFTRPEAFESAVLTYADWRRRADGSVFITSAGRSVVVEVSCEEGGLEFSSMVIRESSTPTRLSWRFASPRRAGVIRTRIRWSSDLEDSSDQADLQDGPAARQ